MAYPKKCPTCHQSIAQDKPCPYCKQNREKQARDDESLALALERLAASGRLAAILNKADLEDNA